MSDIVRDNGPPVAVSAALAEAASELSNPKTGQQSDYYLKQSVKQINTAANLKDGAFYFGATKEPAALTKELTSSKSDTLAVLSRNSTEGLRSASNSSLMLGRQSMDLTGNGTQSPFRAVAPVQQLSFNGNPTFEWHPKGQLVPIANSDSIQSLLPNNSDSSLSVVTRLHEAQKSTPKVLDVLTNKGITTKQILAERETALAENKKQLDPKNPKHYINTAQDMKKMSDLAERLGVPLIVEFGYPGCGFCGQMDRQTNPQFARNNKQVLIAHVNVQEATASGRRDGGASIIKQLQIPFESNKGVPQTYVLAPGVSDGTLVQSPMKNHVGFMKYDYLKQYVPNALPLDVVLRLRGQK